MRNLFFLIIVLGFVPIKAEQLPNPQLKKYADSLRYAKPDSVRRQYNDSFIALIQNLLQTHSGFDLNLDSINQTISVLNADDNRLRLLTWVWVNDKEEFFNHGVVMYRKNITANPSVFWLNDNMPHGLDSLKEVFDEDNWPGALYYQLYATKHKRKRYYTVLGLVGRNSFSNAKVIDVLSVDKFGDLHFGAPLFYESVADKTPQNRVFFEYADQGSMLLRFEPSQKWITFSNLVPSNPTAKGKRAYYVPDGRIDFYELKKKVRWVKKENLEKFDLPGNP